jgi:uronate dehydrogenase
MPGFSPDMHEAEKRSGEMGRILLTGAAGEIGLKVRESLRTHYPLIRLLHRRLITDIREGEEFCLANLESFDEVSRAMAGVDVVVHMGGKAQEGTWEVVLPSNIIGTYNIFEAARQRGVRRVVFASSHHVIGYYRRGRSIGPDDPPRPDSRYAVSKVFGEALGRLYADKYGLSVVCLRIGSYQERPLNVRMLSTWISPRDMVELVRCAIEAKDVHFETVYGVSANSRTWWADEAAVRLGYRPVDNAELFAAEILQAQEAAMQAHDAADVDFSGASMDQADVLKAVRANTPVEPDSVGAFQGGPLCGMEFTGDISKTD